MDIENFKFKYSLTVFLITLIIVGIGPTATPAYWEMGKSIRLARQLAAYYVTTCNYQTDENLLQVYPWPEEVRVRSETLVEYKLNVFSEAILSKAGLELLNSDPSFNIDMLNDKFPGSEKTVILEADKDKTLKIIGWAVDRNAGQAAGGVLINFDGRIEIPALYGLERNDVANYYRNNNYRLSGFEVTLPTEAIGPGQHTVSIDVISADKKAYYNTAQILTLEIK